MKIRLSEIPHEGRSYTFDRESGELNADLADLLDERPYKVDFTIRPIGNAFEMRGSVEASLAEVCSHCGYDFEMKLRRPINEILFEDEEESRKAHSVHGNQSVDFFADGPAMTPYKGDVFNPGEYTHELIALSEPFYPMCGENGACLHADEVKAIRDRLEHEYATAEEKKEGHPAFNVLKGLDLSRKN